MPGTGTEHNHNYYRPGSQFARKADGEHETQHNEILNSDYKVKYSIGILID